MKRIEKINSIFVFYGYRYKNVDFLFLNWIYNQCSLMNIGIIDEVWFDLWHYNIIRDLYLNSCIYKITI